MSEIIKNILLDTVSILNENKIPYLITAGTLLGIIRDNDIIPGDPDADMCVYFSDIKKILNLNEEFKKKNIHVFRGGEYQFREKYNTYWIGVSIKYLNNKSHINFVDIFGMFWWPKLDTIIWNETKISVPKDPEFFLSQIYKNWREKSNQHAKATYICNKMYRKPYGLEYRNDKYKYVSDPTKL